MKGILLVALLSLFLVPSAHAWPGRVVAVADGDTITVEPVQGGKRVKVRLYGIDTPELKQPGGRFAKAFAQKATLYQVVEIEEKDTDRYKRTVAIVHLRGTTLQDLLLRDGGAWVYTKYCKSVECSAWKELEQEAMQAKRGLWYYDNPVPPWEWRKRER